MTTSPWKTVKHRDSDRVRLGKRAAFNKEGITIGRSLARLMFPNKKTEYVVLHYNKRTKQIKISKVPETENHRFVVTLNAPRVSWVGQPFKHKRCKAELIGNDLIIHSVEHRKPKHAEKYPDDDVWTQIERKRIRHSINGIIRVGNSGRVIYLPVRESQLAFGKSLTVFLQLYYCPEAHQLHLIRVRKKTEDSEPLYRSTRNSAGFISGVRAFKPGNYPVIAEKNRLVVNGLVTGDEIAVVLAEKIKIPPKKEILACASCGRSFEEVGKWSHSLALCYECALSHASQERYAKESRQIELSHLFERQDYLQKEISKPFFYPDPEKIKSAQKLWHSQNKS